MRVICNRSADTLKDGYMEISKEEHNEFETVNFNHFTLRTFEPRSSWYLLTWETCERALVKRPGLILSLKLNCIRVRACISSNLQPWIFRRLTVHVILVIPLSVLLAWWHWTGIVPTVPAFGKALQDCHVDLAGWCVSLSILSFKYQRWFCYAECLLMQPTSPSWLLQCPSKYVCMQKQGLSPPWHASDLHSILMPLQFLDSRQLLIVNVLPDLFAILPILQPVL